MRKTDKKSIFSSADTNAGHALTGIKKMDRAENRPIHFYQYIGVFLAIQLCSIPFWRLPPQI